MIPHELGEMGLFVGITQFVCFLNIEIMTLALYCLKYRLEPSKF